MRGKFYSRYRHHYAASSDAELERKKERQRQAQEILSRGHGYQKEQLSQMIIVYILASNATKEA